MDYDVEHQQMISFNKDFMKSAQNDFIKKVYGILSVQLSITTFFCILVNVSTGFAAFLQNNIWLMILSMIGIIIIPIVLYCCHQVSRLVPYNYILLLIFTLCESFLVAAICSQTSPSIVFMAAIMTLGIVVALTVYAMTTKSDFTMMGGALFVFGMAFFLFSIFMIFSNNNALNIIYSSIGVILFGFYLIYDTQLIVGGKSQQLSMDDYILGAMMLYIDIIMIFIHILNILKRSQ